MATDKVLERSNGHPFYSTLSFVSASMGGVRRFLLIAGGRRASSIMLAQRRSGDAPHLEGEGVRVFGYQRAFMGIGSGLLPQIALPTLRHRLPDNDLDVAPTDPDIAELAVTELA